jgi:hypothetical protein
VGLFIVDGVIKIMQASVLSLIRSAASVFASGKSKREKYEEPFCSKMLVHTPAGSVLVSALGELLGERAKTASSNYAD